MSEDVHRPRPVVDPSLDPEHREEVLSAHYRSSSPDPRPARLREGAAQLFGVGFTLALTTALGGWYLSIIIATITAVAYTVALLVRGEANPVVRVSGAFLGAGTLAAVPAWVLDPAAATGLPWLVFGGLAAMVTADGLTCRTRADARADSDRADRLVGPDEVNRADHPLLLEVQYTIDRVSEHAHELGEGTEPGRTLEVLHQEEWRIAGLLARQRTLRRAHLRRWQRAESERVREALRPQREYLDAVGEAVRRRVDSVREYRRVFDRALAAHREWIQCQEARDSTPDYLRHLADAEVLDTGATEVSDLVCAADAAGRVRDEHVRELLGHPLHPDA
ncbi:hypothetical protein [Nocardiopsis salina]|uniref:hypothetical protein n=1 Tax=Nocardiopsis salina TaxID=245836 RepID=UPI00047545EC